MPNETREHPEPDVRTGMEKVEDHAVKVLSDLAKEIAPYFNEWDWMKDKFQTCFRQCKLIYSTRTISVDEKLQQRVISLLRTTPAGLSADMIWAALGEDRDGKPLFLPQTMLAKLAAMVRGGKITRRRGRKSRHPNLYFLPRAPK